MNKGFLYLVATPIGNLEDITFRAIRVLNEVDLIACEDTRQTIKLLNHYQIKKPLFSYHKFNEKKVIPELIQYLEKGENIALVSDAGLPLISDPGYLLVKACREKQIPVTVIPGCNAALPALMLSGFEVNEFSFFGFPPKTKNKKFYKHLTASELTTVFYDSPHHLLKSLNYLNELQPERLISISREITKKFEETVNGTAEELIKFFTVNPPKGEFVIVLDQYKEKIKNDKSIPEQVAELINEGLTSKEAIKKVSKENNLNKREVYEIVKIKKDDK